MLRDLPWLPTPTAAFRDELRALQAEAAGARADDFAQRVISLATAALDEGQLSKLAKLSAAIAAGGPVAGLDRVKLGVLGDGTLSLLGPAIAGSALRHGAAAQIVESDYSQAVQDATDPDSELRQAGLDMALVASDARLLGLDRAAVDAEEAKARVDAAFERIRMIADGLGGSVRSTVLVQTVVAPLEPLFGSYDRVEAGSPFAMVEALNRRLAEWAAEGSVVLVDIARLASVIGYESWDDPRHWHASKLSFSPDMIPAYADVVARTIGAVLGKTRKCLVLDLDNTLWGGVIGDDGLTGIQLGQGSATGEAFVAIQRLALELRNRGIVLAVCSKNEEDAARSPFREHPDMLLTEDHIAVFQANWTDKAANLRAIAEALNIGIDALVFLDDNPAERAQVRREIPQVAVPELPDDPALYPRMLAAAGYFEAVAFSKEDRDRAGYYQANAKRAATLQASGDMDSYLASLDMVCAINAVDPVTRPRVAQLINKSNQFNLTTRRYSEAEVAAAEADPSRHAIQVRLTDTFGDNGIISVIIADKAADAWAIDTWLMSCRVLGRRVEEAVLAHLARSAKEAGAGALIGRYIPSAKNKMVARHYDKLGFERIEEAADGAVVYRLDLAAFVAPNLPLHVDDRVGVPAENMA
ncbi:MAG: HAD-IIIC family phosphatase [Phenylobacterium sp.]|uniref:HAD-IIIC family phosphatase n=1 Tax=Phenylobacterium sp. TaxID=1871053 RepID=UPI0011F508FD|nr:HAD-IIIC family phosphatase [Phenylobacterium sp.]TAJ70615.1 MAG: HAD-IIIC family phosphatase [Phenylobacterium sp.]